MSSPDEFYRLDKYADEDVMANEVGRAERWAGKVLELENKLAASEATIQRLLKLLEPASEWMSADEIDWWKEYNALTDEEKEKL